jgi:hypothetical protein
VPHGTVPRRTDTFEKIGGAKPKTFEELVRDHQHDLATPPRSIEKAA